MREDAKRGWRRVVASPKPKRIVEIHEIKKAVERHHCDRLRRRWSSGD